VDVKLQQLNKFSVFLKFNVFRIPPVSQLFHYKAPQNGWIKRLLGIWGFQFHDQVVGAKAVGAGQFWFCPWLSLIFVCDLGQEKLSVPQLALSVAWDLQCLAPSRACCELWSMTVCKTLSSSAGRHCKNSELYSFNCTSLQMAPRRWQM